MTRRSAPLLRLQRLPRRCELLAHRLQFRLSLPELVLAGLLKRAEFQVERVDLVEHSLHTVVLLRHARNVFSESLRELIEPRFHRAEQLLEAAFQPRHFRRDFLFDFRRDGIYGRRRVLRRRGFHLRLHVREVLRCGLPLGRRNLRLRSVGKLFLCKRQDCRFAAEIQHHVQRLNRLSKPRRNRREILRDESRRRALPACMESLDHELPRRESELVGLPVFEREQFADCLFLGPLAKPARRIGDSGLVGVSRIKPRRHGLHRVRSARQIAHPVREPVGFEIVRVREQSALDGAVAGVLLGK